MRTLRIVAVLAATLLTGLAVSSPVQAAPIPFAADSGDQCRYGSTRGSLDWRLAGTPPRAVAVDVRGTLTDRPVPTDPGPACPDDRRFSIATFTVYAGNVVVDREAQRADNNVVSFGFVLGSNSTVARIDRLVIQVCRHSSTLPPSYCGRAVEYRAP